MGRSCNSRAIASSFKTFSRPVFRSNSRNSIVRSRPAGYWNNFSVAILMALLRSLLAIAVFINGISTGLGTKHGNDESI
ncbi:MAG: hypothetical protein ACFCA4_06675 [Cyanophyceae cyanobacterium]